MIANMSISGNLLHYPLLWIISFTIFPVPLYNQKGCDGTNMKTGLLENEALHKVLHSETIYFEWGRGKGVKTSMSIWLWKIIQQREFIYHWIGWKKYHFISIIGMMVWKDQIWKGGEGVAVGVVWREYGIWIILKLLYQTPLLWF